MFWMSQVLCREWWWSTSIKLIEIRRKETMKLLLCLFLWKSFLCRSKYEPIWCGVHLCFACHSREKKVYSTNLVTDKNALYNTTKFANTTNFEMREFSFELDCVQQSKRWKIKDFVGHNHLSFLQITILLIRDHSKMTFLFAFQALCLKASTNVSLYSEKYT